MILAGNVLYYFEDEKSPEPKGILPLEDVSVSASAEKSFAFSLTHDGGEAIKSAKTVGASGSKRGSLEPGRHTTFVFAAEAEEDRQRWMRALRENALRKRWAEMAKLRAADSRSALRTADSRSSVLPQ